MFDLIIKNGSVLNGTGKDAFSADVAIKDGKIVKIAQGITDTCRVIDATGLTVTPGWIDSHSHSDSTMLTYPDQREKLEQGITLAITGQCGSSAAPKRNETDGTVLTVGEFLHKVKNTPQGSGAVMLVGHNALRRAVMGSENRAPTAQELEAMKQLLRDGLEAGAIGLSFGLIYVPGCYSNMEECIALAEVVAEFDGLLASHIRNEGDFLIEAVEEFLTIIRRSGCKRAVFSHHKAAGRTSNWGKVKTSLAMIDAARAEGLDIHLDVYPYRASGTTLLATFVPKALHPAGTTSVLSLLDDPDMYQRIKEWCYQRWGNEFDWVLVSKCPGHPEFEALTINEIAERLGLEDRCEAAFEIIRLTKGKASGCFFTMCEEDIEYIMKHPCSMICTDSAVAGSSTGYHPRLRAAFPRVLARYVRERGVVSLPEMIRKMTSLPATVYRLAGKGRIAVGADADLCIFDADRIEDKADFTHCTLKNEGLSYVIVDGKVVVEDGVYNGTRAAKILA